MSQTYETNERPACPLLDQRGEDAVQNWRQVLAGIDPATLPAELRAELAALLAAADAPSEREVGADPTPRGQREPWRALVGLLAGARPGAYTARPRARWRWLVPVILPFATALPTDYRRLTSPTPPPARAAPRTPRPA